MSANGSAPCSSAAIKSPFLKPSLFFMRLIISSSCCELHFSKAVTCEPRDAKNGDEAANKGREKGDDLDRCNVRVQRGPKGSGEPSNRNARDRSVRVARF